MRKPLLALIFLISYCTISYAQVADLGGHLNGSFESYTQIYQPDSKTSALVPQDKVGSNNYLKLDYNFGQFSAGMQYEVYAPTIAGFPFTLNQGMLINRYFKYAPENFSIQAGDIYEQFGSGLIFRSWENRQIGINIAIEGVEVTSTPVSFLNL